MMAPEVMGSLAGLLLALAFLVWILDIKDRIVYLAIGLAVGSALLRAIQLMNL